MKEISIEFDASTTAVAVFPEPSESAVAVCNQLALKPYKAVLGIIGAADSIDPLLLPKLTQFFSRGIARAALEAEAVLVDGGTQAGVMALMGEGVASRGNRSTLIGVAPAARVSYPGSSASGAPLESNHSHFVLVEGESWGSETSMLFSLIQALAGKTETLPQTRKAPPAPTSQLPVLLVLAGGGRVAMNEVLRAVRHQLPVLVIAGSGGVADTIAAAWQTPDVPPDDPLLAEILADGVMRFYPLSGSVQGLERLLVRELGADHVLLQAWETFADYDANANHQQKRFEQLQQLIIALGLIGTALAIGQQVYGPKNEAGSLLAASELLTQNRVVWWLVHHILILIPITLTILITALSRFKQGTKRLLLRAGAEAIKREIYRYRTRALYYQSNAESQLAERIEDITRRTMQTEVNSSSLIPYNQKNGFPPTTGSDTGIGMLTPAQYVEVRLGNQLAYFRRKAVRLERQLKVLSWLTFLLGGAGTYMAAIGQQVWIALTTSLVAAMGTFLSYRQTESTLIKFNQAATNLSNIRAWWNALSVEEQLRQSNTDLLVEHTEQVLELELAGWVRQMQDALAELHKNQPATTDRTEKLPLPEPELVAAVPRAPAPAPVQRQPVVVATAPVILVAAEEAPELTADAVLPTEDTADVPLPDDSAEVALTEESTYSLESKP
ncbi:DUF4231 domain-containing protein (plasmid) [Hymenobacter tibetensis]|uniref:DUF4231 domain-containing protein n=1 Tax=Hymenobacter tibetensis TaxID=497967 RepID=A0ABY4D4R2_9BACT|nr:DUF4231 domain-containing protein [Hymenobacter tibetensis]UOG77332.1 DUF4231 domain-containing protein [Hymenobacter tibetensis]